MVYFYPKVSGINQDLIHFTSVKPSQVAQVKIANNRVVFANITINLKVMTVGVLMHSGTWSQW